MKNLIDKRSKEMAINAICQCTNCNSVEELRAYVDKHSLENGWTGGILDAIDAVEALPSADPEDFEEESAERKEEVPEEDDQCNTECLGYLGFKNGIYERCPKHGIIGFCEFAEKRGE